VRVGIHPAEMATQPATNGSRSVHGVTFERTLSAKDFVGRGESEVRRFDQGAYARRSAVGFECMAHSATQL
jgi:hypothetical protein